MADVQNSIGLTDLLTPTLRHIISTINMMISNLEKLDSTTNLVGRDAFEAMRRGVSEAEISLQRMEAQLNDMHNGTNRVRSGFKSWALTLTGVQSALGLIRMAIDSIKAIMAIPDEFIGANARLNLVNDGLQTQIELQKELLMVANMTRASYTSTAELVSKIGMTGALQTNKEALEMAEKVNKLLKIGGGGTQQNDAALLQFTQSLASGRMQGDEFRSLMENAPALMNTIAQGLGVPMGALKEMSSQGELTTDVIIAAMSKMGDEIDRQFEAIPRTFGDNMMIIRNIMGTWMADMAKANGAIAQINQMFTDLSTWLGSEDGQNFLDNLATGLSLIVYIITGVIDAFVWMGNVIEALGPIGDAVIIGGIAAALLYLIPIAWTAASAFISTAASAIAAFAAANLPILLVGLAIGAVIAILNTLGFTAADILSFVGGLFGGLVANIVNGGIFLINTFWTIAEFLVNIFINPVYAIKKLFWDLTSDVLGFFDSLLGGIISGFNWVVDKSNEVLGTDFGKIKPIDIAGLAGNAPAKPDNAVSFGGLDYVDPSKWGNKGAEVATGFLDKMGKNPFEFNNAGSNIGDVGKVGSIGKIDKDVNIAKEDIEMMLDMVTQNRVNQINLQVTTKAPIINNRATVREEADVRKIASEIADIIYEGVEITTDLPYGEDF